VEAQELAEAPAVVGEAGEVEVAAVVEAEVKP
jgi:hypothetical protein